MGQPASKVGSLALGTEDGTLAPSMPGQKPPGGEPMGHVLAGVGEWRAVSDWNQDPAW